jgi:nitrous oxidase accessory protein
MTLARNIVVMFCILLSGFPVVAETAAYPLFQELVDATEPDGLLIPPPGTYAGPVVVESALTIDGQGKVTIDGGNKGTVVLLNTDGATLKGMRLINSGESHNDIDSAVQVRGNFNVIKNNVIENTLFGIDLQKSENNIVRANHISSKPVELGMRGDAIRLWYSFNNKIQDNIVRDSRDMVIWYSKDNLISGNDARGGRYSLHFMYSQFNEVLDNHFEDNSVGIFVMYSDGVVLKNNYIAHATGPTGMGIGFKETSDVVVSDNKVLFCATGIYLDVSPFQPDSINHLNGNLVAYNGVGVKFINDWAGNVLKANRFKGNITQVVVSGGKTANRNIWEGNFWEDYEGFDQDADGVGDRPYELFSYADRIWMDVPPAQFFKGSPLLEALDFLERLAPFTEPNMLVRDKQPLMQAEWNGRLPDGVARVLQQSRPEEAPPTIIEDTPTRHEGFDALKALRESLGH